MKQYKPLEKVLCQDCLRIRDYSDARHDGEELCQCGGDFCGCDDCVSTMNALLAGKRKASDLRTFTDVENWNEIDGCSLSDVVNGKITS